MKSMSTTSAGELVINTVPPSRCYRCTVHSTSSASSATLLTEDEGAVSCIVAAIGGGFLKYLGRVRTEASLIWLLAVGNNA